MKVWQVVRLPKNRLGLQCPQKDCRKKAVVSREWCDDNGYTARPCTYCFKAARIPEEIK